MKDVTVKKIIDIVSRMMESTIKNRTVVDPFIEDDIKEKNPFGYRLVPIEIWKGSKFERSFVTTMGRIGFEKIAKYVAEDTNAYAENDHIREITINTYRKEKIDEILSFQRRNRKDPNWREPNWTQEIGEIIALRNNRFESLRLVFDLYVRREDGLEEFYSIKTVKPNLDQTEIAKKTMLYMFACYEEAETYFALPFNPAGEGNLYRKAGHTIPYQIFNMDSDSSVLIGKEFWNKLGQDENTYFELLNIFESVGRTYSPIIRRDYLGL